MVKKDEPGAQKRRSDIEKEKTLEELKALRQKRLAASGTRQESKASESPSWASRIEAEKKEGIDLSEPRFKDDDAAISAVRASRMQAEAYHDIAKLRKKAQEYQAKAAKHMTKYKAYEAKAQKALTGAIRYREKAAESHKKEKQFIGKLVELEKDLKATLSGETEVTPESVKLNMAKVENKVARAQERARKYEAKAASRNEKAAFHKSKSAFYLEQNKIHEAEVKNFQKRADNLERADL